MEFTMLLEYKANPEMATLSSSRKTETRNVRESNRPFGLERILYEEATQFGADCGISPASGCFAGEGNEGARGLQAARDQRADILPLADEVRWNGSSDGSP